MAGRGDERAGGGDFSSSLAMHMMIFVTSLWLCRILRREKAHENRMTVILDTAEQNMTTLRQTNKRKVQELNAEIARFEIEMREKEEVSESYRVHVCPCMVGNCVFSLT